MKRYHKLLAKSELHIGLVVLAVCLLIQLRSGLFFSSNNLVDIASAFIVPALFALGAFMVIVSGGVDVSFPALASLSIYITTNTLFEANYQGGIWLPLLMCIMIGALLGAINGALISFFKLNALIVTLGTSSIFKGFMQGALNAKQLTIIPPGMEQFGKSALFVATNPDSNLSAKMPVAVFLLLAFILIVWFILRRTLMGRGLYAIGGNAVSAERAGFDVKLIMFLLYVFVGILASIAGFVRVCMMSQCHPTNMLGMEMMIIAGVVLGGTSITGGSGSITGCLVGTLLIVIVQNSMILLGIPTFWQSFALGVLIIVGTGISALQIQRASLRSRKRIKEKRA